MSNIYAPKGDAKYFDIYPPDRRSLPFVVILCIVMFFIGVGVRSYFAAQEAQKIANRTEKALFQRLTASWPEGKYLFCRYEGKDHTKCIQCQLGGKDPLTEFESCSSALQNDIK